MDENASTPRPGATDRRSTATDAPRTTGASPAAGYREDETPWRYETVARNLARVSHHLLDLGTGGGEVLAGLHDVLPEDTVATVTSSTRVAAATTRLAPHGVEVLAVDPEAPGATLPFAPHRFDLVLARHATFDAADVFRVLSAGGTFVTEQVGGDDAHEVLDALGLEPPSPGVTLQALEHELTGAGFRIERSDAFRGHAEFADVPSLLGYLRRVPWLAAAVLDDEEPRERLEATARRLDDGPLVVSTSRFWVLARTPEAQRPPVTDFSRLVGDHLEVPQV